MSVWGSALAADGRTYYFRRGTKETQWVKPDDFDGDEAPAPVPESASGGGGWVEAKTEEGKPYYYNTATKITQWDKPPGFGEQQQQQPKGRPDFVAGGRPDFGSRDRRDDRGHGLPQKPAFDGPRGGGSGGGGGGGGALPWENRQDSMGGGGGFRGPMPAKTDDPEYATPQAAEEAFFKMLKRYNITPDTDWQDALRLVIRDREYRAIKDPQERKLAFEKYQTELRAQEKTKEKERKERVREEFRRMLSTHDEIEHYTRWKTARPMLEREAVFKSAGDEDERRRIFDEYILELKKKHAEDEAAGRKHALHELGNMLQALIIDPDTRWADAEDKIVNNERFVSEDVFKDLHKLDIFRAYENHMKALERVVNDAIQNEKQSKKRRFRKARDAYRDLLNEKLHEGQIKAGTKWQDFFPLIKDDERFLGYLGLPAASTPLDLFWDLVEEEERKLRLKRNDALDVLEEQRWEMTISTSLDEFASLLKSHPRTASLRADDVGLIFERLMEKVKRRADEFKIEAERHQKSAIDSLRSAMKKISPPIELGESYEEVAARMAGLRDFENASEEVRRRAFEKFMLRLKEREDERSRRDRDRSRDRDTHRSAPRRDERDRDRDRRHRTRTPEVDAYEADRRKAQADRERQYRKASFGLTPPPRDRRMDDRYDDRRRPDPRDMYERERREREMERERTFMSRADPRDKGKTLDYGDEDAVGSRPPSVRKRRDSDDGARDSKRSRKEPEGVFKDEEPALQSGSEEGEIEEV